MDTEPAEQPRGHTRSGAGRYVRGEAARLRDADAAELRAAGYSYRQIAEQLDYADKGQAYRGVQRCVSEVVKDKAEQLIAVESARLDDLAAATLEVLERDHYAHSNGKLVIDPNGNPVLDDGPKLAAISEMRRISESYRKLHGLDQPAKVSVDGGVRYEVVGVDPADLK